MIHYQTPLEIIRPPDGKCLGAVFCTYDFDENFFESVLAALLPIHADPESDTHMFLMEARRRLRETPVVVLADGNGYPGGHRLPFHLILTPRSVAFHARMALLLFDDHARMVVGSANLTPAGFGESADLGAVLHLDYTSHAAALEQVLGILEGAGAQGEGWRRFAGQCRAMLQPKGRPTHPATLLQTDGMRSVLEQFLASVPKSAKVTQVHLMVPTQPEDDARSGAKALVPLHEWLAVRAKNAPINLAVVWADPTVAPPIHRTLTQPEQLAGYLCAEIHGPPGGESVSWFPVERVENNKVYVRGRNKPLMRKAVASVMQAEPPRFWAIEEVTGVALLEAIEPFGESHDIHWWLFPETQLHDGHVQRRPFHARLVAVCTTEKNKPYTHLLLGCPNFHRNLSDRETIFEIGLATKLDGHLAITDFAAELVGAPLEGFYLEDRSWLPAEPKTQPPLERATYDARSHLLTLEWQHRAPDCRVTYQRQTGEEELLKERPGLRSTITGFVLDHGSTELRVSWDEQHTLVPITVQNISYLRADEPEHQMGLADLVALHNNRRRDVLGGYLNAQDVFEAQQAIVDSLVSTGQLLGAFEAAMDGPFGLRGYCDCLLQSEECDRSEAWLYGLELYKLLQAVSWTADPFRAYKERVLHQFVGELRERLRVLAPNEPWTVELTKFYGGAA